MCVVSMVTDHYIEKWTPYVQYPTGIFTSSAPTVTIVQSPTAEEVAEFRRLLDRAREYDKRMNEPDCELDSKRQTLKTLAAQLGVDISFV